jgi:aspartate-semialdehyde dehydrogenase
LRIGVLGATGATGLELLGLLDAARHPRALVDCRARRTGDVTLANGSAYALRPLGEVPAQRVWDIAFLCTPTELSRELAPALARSGVRVIDLSSAFRMHADVPLVIPEINASAMRADTRLVANPNCTTAIAALPLAVVAREYGLAEVIVVSYQAASGAGAIGLTTLAWELRSAAGVDAGPAPQSPFASTLASNVIPAIADVGPDGISGEEQKIQDELRKILGLAGLVVESTTARVPVERCHSVAVHARTERPVDCARLVQLLARAPGIVHTDDPHGPRPRDCAGTDPVHVGRVRAGTRGSTSLCFFAVGDQLRKGAALNAFQVAAAFDPRG